MLLVCLVFSLYGKPYGEPIKKGEASITIETLMAAPASFENQAVVVEGKVIAVCPVRGCWMTLKDGEQEVRIKVKDGDIVFDQSLVGKKVLAQGIATHVQLSEMEGRMYAKFLAQAKGEDFEPTQAKGGTRLFQIQGQGVQVKSHDKPMN